ncbi:heme biosynthesis HemY N-terminal domain-containing protein [Sabulicella glaciei]|uniref:Heme biosynthesis protein HemY n=1 Tax=Sabulicella glaciei TaxID=2984948 RepID=A0ABT3NXG4_9PROT|nr:heme biosynthesis protein HemY [Roseococcus sp. MDT2-1-1]
MRVAIKTLLVVGLVVAAILWLAGLGGTVDVRMGEWFIGISLPAAIVALILLFGTVHGFLRIVSWLRGWPARRRQKREARNRAEADRSLTRALVALAAGRAEQARIEVDRARALAGDTPHLLLLSAEAARARGDEEGATDAFEKLAGREDSRFLGLRGLLRQAEARGDWSEARRIAAEAHKAEPNAEWLKTARAAAALRERDWGEALALSGPEAPRAALSLAAAEQAEDPLKAAELERQAFMADPAFSPAVVAHARRLVDTGSPRRGRAVLREGWAAAPHPDIGAAYVAEEPDATTRIKLVDELTRDTTNHPESRLLRAQVALQAGLTGRARQDLQAWMETGAADRRCYDLLVQVERADLGDEAAREKEPELLRLAADAPAAPTWRCRRCGAEHNRWKPLCQACDTAGEIGWSGEAVRPSEARAG